MKVEKDISLSEITAWKVGGKIEALITVDTLSELKSCISNLKASNTNYTVIGQTTNLLFTSKNINGVLIKLSGEFDSVIKSSESNLFIGAACWVPKVARTAMKYSLSGIEHIVGIPGSFGGLIRMNGGSQRKSISESINYVLCLKDNFELVKLKVEDCSFSYRESIFKKSNLIILGAEISLKKRNKRQIRREYLQILSSRRKKFPKNLPNCGSVFKSNPEFYKVVGTPGFAIEKVGLKGYSIGDAQVSDLHANFIVNNGNASSDDILNLIKLCEKEMETEFGFSLEPEVQYIDENCNLHEIKSL